MTKTQWVANTTQASDLAGRGTVIKRDAVRTPEQTAGRVSETGRQCPVLPRAGLITELEQLLASGEAVTVLAVHIDGFLNFGDTVVGWEVPQKLLSEAGARLQSVGMPIAVGRLSEHDFGALVIDQDHNDVGLLAHRIVYEVEQLAAIANVPFSVRANVGVAYGSGHAENAELFLMRAMNADGTNHNGHCPVNIAHESVKGTVDVDTICLADQLADGIAQGQIEVWFQPKVNVATGCVVGAECLARWRHPDLGLLTPDRFLPLLMLSGCYDAFTDEVIRQGIAFAARNETESGPVDIAVNVGAMSFVDCGLAERVGAMLAAAGLAPERLTLEIVETEIPEELALCQPALDALVSLGIRLSIDDFGVGYSSLSRLHKLPVNEVKIDRSFVSAMSCDADAELMVRAIVRLASTLGYQIVAEGVEDRATAMLLRGMHRMHAQGFLFGKPMPAADFIRRFCQST